jgi:hypothetical protein
MACEYSRSNGYQSALKKFHDKVNELMDLAIEESKTCDIHQPEYWRTIGKQDILLELLSLTCKWVGQDKNV